MIYHLHRHELNGKNFSMEHVEWSGMEYGIYIHKKLQNLITSCSKSKEARVMKLILIFHLSNIFISLFLKLALQNIM